VTRYPHACGPLLPGAGLRVGLRRRRGGVSVGEGEEGRGGGAAKKAEPQRRTEEGERERVKLKKRGKKCRVGPAAVVGIEEMFRG